ncbi:MAG: hypothetical protein V5B38_23930 [Candidatus Accumulibacter propinquus]
MNDPSLAVSHHLLDSLAVLPFVEGRRCSTLAVAVACPAFRWRSPARPARRSARQQFEEDGLPATGGN